ncbi:MAG TPA: patatin-like phospholipase family protein, partial [Gaiellaceae bacterium]|nr:patatin-like phospholipase family protein [Gaiellaceae bacterium]
MPGSPKTVALLALWVVGCMPPTPRLTRGQYGEGDRRGKGGYRYDVAADSGPSAETLFLVSFSGGGTRAAAFAYGVLEGLHDARLGDGRTLVDEIDAVSSVSGGSFAAAYLALFGQTRFFARFPDEVLHRKIERGFALRILNPLDWPWLLSPRYGRGDLAADYYDREIFEGKTFADLVGKRPFVVLNATDIARGAQFSFIQDHFDRLCADLSPVTIGRAVAASSAFPIVFTPLTLENRPKSTCGYVAPPWVAEAEQGDFETTPVRWDLARTWRSYEDASVRRYIHLSDGGLSDNIGLRSFETAFRTGAWGLVGRINDPRLKRVVVIVVDAKPRAPSCLDTSAHPSSVFSVLDASATNPMENYSSDTIEHFR